MIIGVTKETFPGERRVALVPASVSKLKKMGVDVSVEAHAGEAAGFLDQAYEKAGAKIVVDRSEIIQSADILLQVRAAVANPEFGKSDLEQLKAGQVLIAQCDPLSDPEMMKGLAEKKALIFALELVPRITRAQSMDVLSSMATIAGYKAALLAASHSPQMFPMMMTAAGTLAPARVFILGVGVAGLQAIATAKRLGAVVSAYDLRPEVKEQVESLGAKFIVLDLESGEGEGGYAREMNEEFYRKQQEQMLAVISESDVIITTAAVPGKKAPTLVTEEMVKVMPPGGVIVDLAAERGGNCELTKAGEVIVEHDITIVGPMNIPSDIPRHASQMYSNNVTTFLKPLIKDGVLEIDFNDEIVAGTLVTHNGEIVHPLCRKLAGLPELEVTAEPEVETPADTPKDTPISVEGESSSEEPPAANDASEETPKETTAESSTDDKSDSNDDDTYGFKS